MYWAYSITFHCAAILGLSNSWYTTTSTTSNTYTLIIELKLTLSSHSTLFPRYATDIALLWNAVLWVSQDGVDGQICNS